MFKPGVNPKNQDFRSIRVVLLWVLPLRTTVFFRLLYIIGQIHTPYKISKERVL